MFVIVGVCCHAPGCNLISMNHLQIKDPPDIDYHLILVRQEPYVNDDVITSRLKR